MIDITERTIAAYDKGIAHESTDEGDTSANLSKAQLP